MSIQAHLHALAEAGLINAAGTGAADREYQFRHALLQETAYRSLLRQERQQLHLAVGRVLEKAYPDRHDELAYHFEHAHEWARALAYYRLAGEAAMERYALDEATGHYSNALPLAQRVQDRPAQLALYQALGAAYETRGDFQRARANHEAALTLAREWGERQDEWQSLVDLGRLWASREYARAGAYFDDAVALAERQGDRKLLAASLNWTGNWKVNKDRPHEGRVDHDHALQIFEALEDEDGITQTLDLLGMAGLLSGDLREATLQYRRAIQRLRGLRDMQERLRLSSVLANLSLCAGSYQTSILVPVTMQEEALDSIQEAQEIAQRLGWRAGEAYSYIMTALSAGYSGEYAPALEAAHRALQVAREIQHRQWTTFAHYTLGKLYTDLLHLEEARHHTERAFELAHEVKSVLWQTFCAASLAQIALLQGDVRRASLILEEEVDATAAPRSLAQGTCLFARAELALAAGDAARALEHLDTLVQALPNPGRAGEDTRPAVALLRGRILVVLGQYPEAESVLGQARSGAEARGLRPLLWRSYLALAELFQQQGRSEEQEAARATAQQLIDGLAATIPGADLRRNFVVNAVDLYQ
jgi:tetratricopeptide (TPR) repeat protein